MKPAAAAAPYRIVPAGEGIDAYQKTIEELWKNNLPRSSVGRFDWLYRQNPRGPARTWLLAGDRGAVLGLGSLYPRRMMVGGKECMAGVAVDFAIEKNHRILGPALKIQKAIIKDSPRHGFRFNCAYPSENSAAVFHRAGYRPIGEIWTGVKPLTVRKLLAEYHIFATLARAASGTIDLLLRLNDRWRARIHRARDAVFEVLERCDGRFDALWQEAGARYAVIGEKGAAFLNWRYADNSTDRYRFWCMFSADRRRLKGFIVFTVRENVVRIADLFVDDHRKGALLPLLLEFSLQMRREGVSHVTVSYFGDDLLVRQLQSLGFIERKTKRVYLVCWDASCAPDLVRAIADKQNWFHFGGDLDLS